MNAVTGGFRYYSPFERALMSEISLYDVFVLEVVVCRMMV
jgi:hypothetical protein